MDTKKVIVLCASVAATVCFVTALFTYNYVKSQERGNEIRLGSGNYEDIAKYMEIGDLERMIEEHYYQAPDDARLVSGALKGMVDSLGDPYSVYYTEDEYREYTEGSDGAFVGVGLAVVPYDKSSGYLRVARVHKSGPADLGGVLQDDVIIAVNGVNIHDLDFDGSNSLINGPSGSEVTLTVSTNGAPRDVKLTRTEVQVPFAFETMLDDRIGYITISEFGGACVEEFRDCLQKLKEVEEADGVVIDLRDNMGGNVKNAIDILDQVMPEGLLAYSVDKDGERSDWNADGEYDPIPFALIVNGSTASAGEVFAGAVKDAGRGDIIGTQTFGKGVSQVVQDMPYSGGGVKLTTAAYFTPKGNEINGRGVAPDSVVEMPTETQSITAETDPQLQAAKTAVYARLGGV